MIKNFDDFVNESNKKSVGKLRLKKPIPPVKPEVLKINPKKIHEKSTLIKFVHGLENWFDYNSEDVAHMLEIDPTDYDWGELARAFLNGIYGEANIPDMYDKLLQIADTYSI